MDLEAAHKYSSYHREAVLVSDTVGCFYCLCVSEPKSIVEWIDGGETALCPRCGIDSLIPSATGLLATPGFLEDMSERWFLLPRLR